jgi:hypothetical protein
MTVIAVGAAIYFGMSFFSQLFGKKGGCFDFDSALGLAVSTILVFQ